MYYKKTTLKITVISCAKFWSSDSVTSDVKMRQHLIMFLYLRGEKLKIHLIKRNKRFLMSPETLYILKKYKCPIEYTFYLSFVVNASEKWNSIRNAVIRELV